MRSRRLVGALVVVLGLAPALAGCGSEDGPDDDVPTITTRPSTSATASETPTDSPSAAVPETSGTSIQPTSEPPATTSPPDDPSAGPQTYADALERIDTVGATAGAPNTTTRFSTPRDVVYCLLASDFIGPTCELRLGAINDPTVCGNAPSDSVGRIEITESGVAAPQCNTDTVREPGANVVQPPAVVKATSGGVECAVEQVGVTCVDRGHRTGFFLGPGEYHVFGA